MLPKHAGVIQDGDGLCLDAAGSRRGHLFEEMVAALSQAPTRITMLITTGKGCVEGGGGEENKNKAKKNKAELLKVSASYVGMVSQL